MRLLFRQETCRLRALGPEGLHASMELLSSQPTTEPELPHLIMPAHHEVRSGYVFVRRLHGTLAAAAERGPADFPDLLLTPGVGARTVRSLAMVAEVVHGAPYRLPILHGSRSHMAARTATPILCRSKSMTRPFAF